MKTWQDFTGFDWLLVDTATRYGIDKVDFNERISWTVTNILPLLKVAANESILKILMEPFIDKADVPSMFTGAVIATWDTINGRESTWQVGQDAASSGPQLLSLLLKDKVGMLNTGTLGRVFPDLYSSVTDQMNTTGKIIERVVVKKGVIPHVYASERAPKSVFGKDYPRFLKAYKAVVPMAQKASDLMVSIWNPYTTEHCWTMPDMAYICVPVLVTQKKTIPLGKHTFEYTYQELGNIEKGHKGSKALSANITHSYDGYILRELNRRCNYDVKHIERCIRLLKSKRPTHSFLGASKDKLLELQALSVRFNQVSVVAFEYLDEANVQWLSDSYSSKLLIIAENMLQYPSREITNIHDEFKRLPNHVTSMKIQYNVLMMETYLSNWWFETVSDLSSDNTTVIAEPIDYNILDEILNAPYAIN